MNNLFKKVVSSVALVAMLAALIPTASFAATISDGDLVKAAGSSAIYLIQDGKKRVFPHSSVYLSWGYPANYSTVKTVTAEELAAYAEGDAVIYRDGFMFRFKGVGMTGGFDPSAVFFVSDGKVRPIESASAYMKLFNGGVNESSAWDRVYWIPDDLLAKFTYPQGSNVTSAQIDAGQLPNGLVVRDSNSLYYVVNNGQLSNVSSTGLSANRYTANSNVFSKMLVTKLANSVLNLMPAGAAITTADTSLLTVKKLTVTPSATNVILSSDKTSVEADGASYATLTATVPSTVTSVSFALNGSGSLSALTVTPVNGVATVRVTPAAASVSGTLTVTASATGLTSASVTVTTVANTLAPQIVSVSNQGMRLINVAFDRLVDKTTAETSSNYTLRDNKTNSIAANSGELKAKLLSDGKTVQLFIDASANSFKNDSTEDSIEIKNVKNLAQTATISTVTKLLTVTDTSVPTVVAVEALGSKAIRVTLSEPVKNIASTETVGSDTNYKAFRLDDKILSSSATGTNASSIYGVTISYPDASDYTRALVKFTSPISVGAHTLTVSYNGVITDYNVTADGSQNNYTMQPAGYVATVVSDTTVPTLSSVEVLSQTKVRYTFSKSLNVQGYGSDGSGDINDLPKFFWSTSSSVNSGTPASSIVKVSDSVFDVTWLNAISTGNIYFYAGSVTDYSGNSISPLPSYKGLNVLSDTAPKVMSVNMTTDSDKEIVVTFDKDVDKTSSENTSNYVLKTISGVTLKTEDTGFVSSTGNPSGTLARTASNLKEVKITNGTYSISGGSYQLCVTNVKASSGVSTSAMNEQCVSFVVVDKTKPTLSTSATYPINASAKRIVISFSEAMDPANTLNAANYKVQYAYGVSGDSDYSKDRKLSDVSGVTLSLKDNKNLIIDFSYDGAVNSGTKITLGYIDNSTINSPKDLAGNVFTTLNTPDSVDHFEATNIFVGYGYGYNVAGYGYGVGYGISSAKITSSTTLEVVFNRDIETISASDFQIKVGNDWVAVSSATIDSSNKSKVVFAIPNTIGKVFTATDTSKKIGSIIRTSTSSPTSKDYVGLSFIGMNTSNMNLSDLKSPLLQGNTGNLGITVSNDIKPNLISAVIVDENTVMLSFDGKINYTEANLINLAKDLSITVNGSTYSGYGVGYGSTNNIPTSELGFIINNSSAVATSNVIIELGKPAGLNGSVVVKTVSTDGIRSKGDNDAKIAANTNGITATTFAIGSVAYGYGSAVGYTTAGVSYGYGVALSFTRTFKPASISTDSSFNVSTGYGDLTSRSASYNPSTGKLTINGVGEISGFTYSGTATYNSSRYVYDVTNNKLYVYFMNNTDGLMEEMYTNKNLIFTPVSALQSTADTGVSTTFLTEVK